MVAVAVKEARDEEPLMQQKTAENTDEKQYLRQIGEILINGEERDDRTGTGTISWFGMQARYSLRNGTMPLLTTKLVNWKAIVGELMWFISGDTNANNLAAKGVKIWVENGKREFLDKRGLTDNEEGDLGPVYGFQWRHWGADYKDCSTDYSGAGVDQLAEVINLIKNDPYSRRIIISAWNPSDLHKMALPPCHTLSQFWVSVKGELSCQLYQRSGDMGLGVPFNIASYALLTHMIAHVTGLKAGDFVHTLGDAHIYKNHIDQVKSQMEREPHAFPKIRFADGIGSIDDFTSDKIILEGYNPHPIIKMAMSA